MENFNPRSHEGSDKVISVDGVWGPISIHAPTRGATISVTSSIKSARFQSTLPRGERQHTVFETLQATISIHAPTRGATAQCSISRRVSRVFQSTLPRGERHMVLFVKRTTHRDFNPRSHEGSDLSYLQAFMPCIISIHAPTRGATAILSKIHPMFLTISHNASSFSSFPFHSFLPHLLNSSTFCALFQVRISRAFSVYYRFAPKKSTPDLQLYHVLHRYVQL